MKLDFECIRSILLTFEEKTDGYTIYTVGENNLKDFTNKYSFEVYIYHINQCLKHGYLEGKEGIYFVDIKDLSPLGHYFVAEIRSDTAWKKFLNMAKDIGVASLPSLLDVIIKYAEKSISTL